MGSRILLVEDEPAIAEAVAYALQDAGFEVDAVGDGGDALEASRRRDYDLMILDLLLPGMSGLNVCRTVRADRKSTRLNSSHSLPSRMPSSA